MSELEPVQQNILIPITSLFAHKRNYRQHPPEQIKMLKASLERWGQVRSLVVTPNNDGTYTIVAGHGVVQAAQELVDTHASHYERFGKLRADIVPSSWNRLQIEGYIAADNQLSMHASDDEELLAALLSEQQDAGYDLASLGTDDETLRQMLEALGDEYAGGGEIDAEEDEIPENIERRTQVGDFWRLGMHYLLVDDCTKTENLRKLMQGKKADMMFTDPPYGVDYAGGHFHTRDGVIRPREKLANDNSAEIYGVFLPVVLPFVDGPCYVWFADSKAYDVYKAVHDNKCETHALILWHKTNAQYAALNAQYKQRHEPLVYFKPKDSTLRWIGPSNECTVWEYPRESVNEFHPTQKPIVLSLRAIGNHEVETILDVFGGSGSTLIACERAGKVCRMMELNPQYADVILARWEQETGQTATLLERIEEAAHA